MNTKYAISNCNSCNRNNCWLSRSLRLPFTTQQHHQTTITLQGAGATFPYPFLNAIITNYSTNVKPNVQVNYQSIGSGGGISAYKQHKTVDFAASDAPLSCGRRS